MTTTGNHPVDSATRACCQGIGRHTPDCLEQRHLSVAGVMVGFPEQEGPAMTITTVPNVPIPAGAASVGDWDGGGRLFYGSVLATIDKLGGWLPEDVRVCTGGSQTEDGAYAWEVVAGPVHPDYPLTAAQARRIGGALIAAADELNQLAVSDGGSRR